MPAWTKHIGACGRGCVKDLYDRDKGCGVCWAVPPMDCLSVSFSEWHFMVLCLALAVSASPLVHFIFSHPSPRGQFCPHYLRTREQGASPQVPSVCLSAALSVWWTRQSEWGGGGGGGQVVAENQPFSTGM